MNDSRHLVHSPRLAGLALAVVALTALPGCALVEGIFKAGVWVGVLAILGLVVAVSAVLAVVRRK